MFLLTVIMTQNSWYNITAFYPLLHFILDRNDNLIWPEVVDK